MLLRPEFDATRATILLSVSVERRVGFLDLLEGAS